MTTNASRSRRLPRNSGVAPALRETRHLAPPAAQCPAAAGGMLGYPLLHSPRLSHQPLDRRGRRARRAGCIADGRAFIGAFWHGRMLMIPMGWQRMAPMHMLISAHRDGRIIADAVSYFGIQAIAGSTRRGGSAALRNMLKKLKEGDCVAITPDGPRGPAMKRQHRHRKCGKAGRSADCADHLCHEPAADTRRAGTTFMSRCRSAAGLLMGRADRDRARSR